MLTYCLVSVTLKPLVNRSLLKERIFSLTVDLVSLLQRIQDGLNTIYVHINTNIFSGESAFKCNISFLQPTTTLLFP